MGGGGGSMRLTLYTDYTLRTLMYLGLHADRLCSISEIAKSYRISENHLTKVAHQLGRLGFITTLRGRGGGLKLAAPPDKIGVGQVVRAVEEGFMLVDCRSCAVLPACRLTGVLAEATGAFLAVLDRYSLADLIGRRDEMRRLLALVEMAAGAEPAD